MKYFDKAVAPISKESWQELQKDDSYRICRQFENGAIRLTVEWIGAVNDTSVFHEYWPMFQLRVFNCTQRLMTEQGETKTVTVWVADPVEDLKLFGTEHLALTAYRKFLERWTDSEYAVDRNGRQEFVEVGNLLAPPPPPNPDAPVSEVEILDDGVGAW